MGENVLVPCGETVFSHNGLFMLNSTACTIWKILPEVSDENEIVQSLTQEYEIEPEQARADVERFLSSLREYGIID